VIDTKTHARSHEETGHLKAVHAGTDSPATRFLEALHRGDLTAALAECTDATTVTADTMGWSCQGLDAIECVWVLARERFAGLTYEPHARSVGFGQIFEDGRVRDLEEHAAATDVDGATTEPRHAAGHEEPALDTDELGPNAMTVSDIIAALDAPRVPVAQRQLVLWRDWGDPADTPPLNMPVRVTVRHDDLQVHEIGLAFPAALLRRALGEQVDPLEISLSEVQSAFMSQSGTTFTSKTLDRPVLFVVPPLPAEPEPATRTVVAEPAPRRRRLLVPVGLALVAVLAGAGWWVLQGSHRGSDAAATPVAATSGNQAPAHDASTGTKQSPTPGKTARAATPNVVLKSDLAFGFDSSTLSAPAKAAIAQVAQHVRQAGLKGKIYVDGYTDSLGSAAHGKVLSQHRADAVASYLRSHLGQAPVTVVAVGHGEADPVTSNATATGRKQNRRVTITLPTA
jgi:outer membrane protein OmpA-like peptidoglycan-associated protein